MTIDKGEIRTSFRLAKDKRKQTSVKPILFNIEMVRAILDGRKTVTRRALKPQPMIESTIYPNIDVAGKVCAEIWGNGAVKYIKQPYHRGDVLWVRETWRLIDFDFIDTDWSASVQYRADMEIGERWHDLSPDERTGWRPSIHMPREAARIWLRVTDVRVERLQEISYEDLRREGGKSDFYKFKRCRACGYGEPHYPECDYEHCDNYERLWEESFVPPFMKLWDSTIKHADLDCYGWYANPWVWVIAFERCEKPEEA